MRIRLSMRQYDTDPHAAALPGRFHSYFAAMRSDDGMHDGEAQAGATLARFLMRCAAERREEVVRGERRGQARPLVFHPDRHPLRAPLGADADYRLVRGELVGV